MNRSLELSRHPACCRDPENCTLTYVEHLRGLVVAADATPNRKPVEHRNNIREARWNRDMAAYKRLKDDGYSPAGIDGARLREREGKTRFDIEHREVTIDWKDPTHDNSG